VLWLEPSPGSHPSKIKVKKKLWLRNRTIILARCRLAK